MEPEKITICPRTLIGIEGDTREGDGFIARLWQEANSRFGEIAHLVKTTPDGHPTGIWGAMTDRARRFQPWDENFTDGLYLAGCELAEGENPTIPDGWTCWSLPGFVCLAFAVAPGEDTFATGLTWLRTNHIPLAGAVQEWTVPGEGKSWLLFPMERM